jgi:hypothetical protein
MDMSVRKKLVLLNHTNLYSNLVCGLKLLSAPQVFANVFTKTFGFKPPYPCSVVRCMRNCAQLNYPRELRPEYLARQHI